MWCASADSPVDVWCAEFTVEWALVGVLCGAWRSVVRCVAHHFHCWGWCGVVCVVLGYAGSPSDDDLKFVKSSRALAFMKKQDGKPKVPLGTVFKGANPQVCAPPWVLHPTYPFGMAIHSLGCAWYGTAVVLDGGAMTNWGRSL